MSEPLVIAPSGDIDLGSVAGFQEWLDDAIDGSDEGVIIDLTEVSFIDSTGLRVLVDLNRRLSSEERELAVVAPRGTTAAEVLTLTGLRRGLNVYESARHAREDG